MRKIIIALLLVSITATSISAQGLSNWFSQKASAKKNKIQQIAFLQLYMGYAEKGYSIAKDGLNLIGDVKTGDFNLHNDYFNSLKTVSPKVKSDEKVLQINTYYSQIKKLCQQSTNQLKNTLPAGSPYLTYTTGVYLNLLEKTSDQISNLLNVLTDGDLTLTEDQRVQRINRIYLDMQDKYAFCQKFSHDNSQYLLQILKEQDDMQLIERFYEYE